MSHHRQKQRKERIEQVEKWLKVMSVKMAVANAQMTFGCTREKAIEYIAEVTRE